MEMGQEAPNMEYLTNSLGYDLYYDQINDVVFFDNTGYGADE